MKKTAISIACILVILSGGVQALKAVDPDAPQPPAPAPPPRVSGTIYPVGGSFGGIYAGLTLSLPNPTTPTGWIEGLIGGNRDFGSFLCNNCLLDPTSPDASLIETQITEMFTDVINPMTWGGKNGIAWRPGDHATICNGTLCVGLTFMGYVTNPWKPKNGLKDFRPDSKKGYKNPGGYSVNTSFSSSKLRQSLHQYVDRTTGNVVWVTVTVREPDYVVTVSDLVVVAPPTETITVSDLVVAPPAPAPAPAAGGGGGCVHVDSRLPDGRRAGDVKVGDTMLLADETLKTIAGIVTYSERKFSHGWRITTKSGVSLMCSDSAPILTTEGYILAPLLLGKNIATRIDVGLDSRAHWEQVEVLQDVGIIEIQHITVGDRAFWAGEREGLYILHHNLKETTGGGSGQTSNWDNYP
jgi:hypothetical protein